MLSTAVTPRAIAKTVTEIVVSANATALTRRALDEYTEVDTDRTSVEVGTALLGQIVAGKLTRVTDPIIDKTADKMLAWKNRKKQDETTES